MRALIFWVFTMYLIWAHACFHISWLCQRLASSQNLVTNEIFYNKLWSLKEKMNCSCPTCLETFTQNCLIYSTPCGHIYHLNCIERWLKDNVSCPQCRKRCIWSDLRRTTMIACLFSQIMSKIVIMPKFSHHWSIFN